MSDLTRQIMEDTAMLRAIAKHLSRSGHASYANEGAELRMIADRFLAGFRRVTAIDHACAIIEAGDNRLLARDGPASGPPDISLAEWRELYTTLDKARTV